MASTKRSSDATRAERKAKKRKLEDAIPDLPGDLEAPEEFEKAEKPSKKRKRGGEDAGGGENGVSVEKDEKAAKEERKEKKRLKRELAAKDVKNGDGGEEVAVKKSKKARNSDGVDEAEILTSTNEASELALEEETVTKKSKKERKAERKAAGEAANSTEQAASTGTTNDSSAAPTANGGTKSKKNNRNREKKRKGEVDPEPAPTNTDAETAEGKASRFIVFIGNLPFTTTTASIRAHFLAVKPTSIRHLTEKDNPSKSKGCAFIEFDGYDHMKTCLKLFHHSLFDDGVSPPRKINVELTAGGGGNTKDRKAKIEGKNRKLNEQRVRRIHEEEKVKGAKKEGIDESAIHPSRRARVPVAT